MPINIPMPYLPAMPIDDCDYEQDYVLRLGLELCLILTVNESITMTMIQPCIAITIFMSMTKS